MKKIAVYTDDVPVSEDIMASGMCRVNTRLFGSLDNISVILATKQHSYFSQVDIEESLKAKTVLTPAFLYNKFAYRLFNKMSVIFNVNFQFILERNSISSILKKSSSNILFSPLGADIAAYERVIYLSKKSGLKLAVYIVDDFESSTLLNENEEAQRMVKNKLLTFLNSTDFVFVISEGMKNRLTTKYNIASRVLNLPYDLSSCRGYTGDIKNEILFLGNTSHFYLSGIRDMLSVLALINCKRAVQNKIFLRLTTSKIPSSLISFESHIICKPFFGKDALAEGIQNSLLCFIPYSFDKKYKVMVSTSFPSKTLECLAYARNILVYGPTYSSSIKYFEKNGLQITVSEESVSALHLTVEKIILADVGMQNSSSYKKVLLKNHSYNKINETFNKAINEKSAT